MHTQEEKNLQLINNVHFVKFLVMRSQKVEIMFSKHLAGWLAGCCHFISALRMLTTKRIN